MEEANTPQAGEAAGQPAAAAPRRKKFRWMMWCRRAHLYLGCFFTPMLMFYILTGWFQTVNDERLKDASEAESFLQKVRAVHVEAIYPSDEEFKNPSKPTLFKAAAVAMCLMASVTILLGVILAFKTIKQKWLVALVLIIGTLLPILFLKMGQKAGKPLDEIPALAPAAF